MDNDKIRWTWWGKEGFTTLQHQGLADFPLAFSVDGADFSPWDVGDSSRDSKLYRTADGRSILLRDDAAVSSGW